MKFPLGELIFKTFDYILVHRRNQKLICLSTAFSQRNRYLKNTFPDHMKLLTKVGQSSSRLPIYPVTSPPNHLATNGMATKEQTRHQDTVYSPRRSQMITPVNQLIVMPGKGYLTPNLRRLHSWWLVGWWRDILTCRDDR